MNAMGSSRRKKKNARESGAEIFSADIPGFTGISENDLIPVVADPEVVNYESFYDRTMCDDAFYNAVESLRKLLTRDKADTILRIMCHNKIF